MIIIEPSDDLFSSFKSINIEGVEESPVVSAFEPVETIPLTIAFSNFFAEILGSCPTDIRTDVLPVFSFNHVQNAAAIS